MAELTPVHYLQPILVENEIPSEPFNPTTFLPNHWSQLMSIETKSITTDDQPSTSQLDKIVESLGLLINMQVDRDQRETEALATIEKQLGSLKQSVDQLRTTQGEIGGFTSREPNAELNKPESGNPEPGEPEFGEPEFGERTSILAQYGLLNDSEQEGAALDSSEIDEPESESVVSVESNSEEPQVESPAPKAMGEADAREIEELKNNLRKQLRDAEVELSIKRANLMQRQAAIEEREAQLNRAARLQQNSNADGDGDPDKPKGILARLKKQLNGIKQASDEAASALELSPAEHDSTSIRTDVLQDQKDPPSQ